MNLFIKEQLKERKIFVSLIIYYLHFVIIFLILMSVKVLNS